MIGCHAGVLSPLPWQSFNTASASPTNTIELNCQRSRSPTMPCGAVDLPVSATWLGRLKSSLPPYAFFVACIADTFTCGHWGISESMRSLPSISLTASACARFRNSLLGSMAAPVLAYLVFACVASLTSQCHFVQVKQCPTWGGLAPAHCHRVRQAARQMSWSHFFCPCVPFALAKEAARRFPHDLDAALDWACSSDRRHCVARSSIDLTMPPTSPNAASAAEPDALLPRSSSGLTFPPALALPASWRLSPDEVRTSMPPNWSPLTPEEDLPSSSI